MTVRRVLPLVALLLGCSGDADSSRAAESSAGAATARVEPPATTMAAGDTACPATGAWAWCSVIERLERAGLVPLHDSTAEATEPPLTARGALVRVGRAEVELYLYPDAASREREQRQLDPARYVTYGASQTLRAEPTLIGNANLIAILHSNSSKQRERVGDALTAGPPQPIERP